MDEPDEIESVESATLGGPLVGPIWKEIWLLELLENALNAIQYFPLFKNCIHFVLIIDIIDVLWLVSKIPVPAVGIPVKKPIAEDIANSPVVFGEISQVPVSDLNCRYSNVAGVKLKPLLTHFVFDKL